MKQSSVIARNNETFFLVNRVFSKYYPNKAFCEKLKN